MLQNALSRLFANTHGDIYTYDPKLNVALECRDFDALALFIEHAECPLIDLVTSKGEAAGTFISGYGLAMFPPPSIPLEEGGIYFTDGNPILGKARDRHHITPELLNYFDDLFKYALDELDVKHIPALAKPNKSRGPVDASLLFDRTEEEKRHFRELNESCAVTFMGNQLRVIWQPDKTKPAKFITVKDAAARESTRIVEVKSDGGGTKKVPAFTRWMQWPGRIAYDEVGFAPGSRDPRIFNLFDGWAVTPRAGNWSRLHDHIRDVICRGDDEQFCWLMTWLAHMFQRPGQKPTVAIVIRGMKGTGKSILFDFIQRLMPHYFYKVADGKRALGNFNAQYESTLCLLMEEALWAGDQPKESILKDMITSPTIAIERKGIDPYMAKNYMRVAMVSNERWVVPATHEERRFAVFDCGNEHRGDTDYFNEMSAQMNAGGLAAMLFDLLTYVPAQGWDMLRKPPITSGLKEQVVDSLRGAERFMHELLTTGAYECEQLDEGGIFLSEDRETHVSMRDLRIAAKDYLADHHSSQKAANYGLLRRAVTEWFGAEIETRRTKQNAVSWVVFPSLRECREHIRRTKGIEITAPTAN